jgi:hypothetical protein
MMVWLVMIVEEQSCCLGEEICLKHGLVNVKGDDYMVMIWE